MSLMRSIDQIFHLTICHRIFTNSWLFWSEKIWDYRKTLERLEEDRRNKFFEKNWTFSKCRLDCTAVTKWMTYTCWKILWMFQRSASWEGKRKKEKQRTSDDFFFVDKEKCMWRKNEEKKRNWYGEKWKRLFRLVE